MPAEEIEKILEPKRLVRIFGSIFLTIVLFFTLIVGVKMAVNAMNSVEATSHDHAWFKTQMEEIHNLRHKITFAEQTLATHKKEVDSRWISREDDRAQTAKLSEEITSLKEKRSEQIKEYNIAADLTSDKILQALPRSVPKEKKEHEHED